MSKEISHNTINKKKILDASDILFLLDERMGESTLKFPLYVDFQLLKEARVLVISMKMYVSTKSEILIDYIAFNLKKIVVWIIR